MRVYAKHEPYWDTGQLGEVVGEMRMLGRPEIQVVQYGGEFYALEGSHRLAAAHYLGIKPYFKIMGADADSDSYRFWNKIRETLPCYEF